MATTPLEFTASDQSSEHLTLDGLASDFLNVINQNLNANGDLSNRLQAADLQEDGQIADLSSAPPAFLSLASDFQSNIGDRLGIDSDLDSRLHVAGFGDDGQIAGPDTFTRLGIDTVGGAERDSVDVSGPATLQGALAGFRGGIGETSVNGGGDPGEPSLPDPAAEAARHFVESHPEITNLSDMTNLREEKSAQHYKVSFELNGKEYSYGADVVPPFMDEDLEIIPPMYTFWNTRTPLPPQGDNQPPGASPQGGDAPPPTPQPQGGGAPSPTPQPQEGGAPSAGGTPDAGAPVAPVPSGGAPDGGVPDAGSPPAPPPTPTDGGDNGDGDDDKGSGTPPSNTAGGQERPDPTGDDTTGGGGRSLITPFNRGDRMTTVPFEDSGSPGNIGNAQDGNTTPPPIEIGEWYGNIDFSNLTQGGNITPPPFEIADGALSHATFTGLVRGDNITPPPIEMDPGGNSGGDIPAFGTADPTKVSSLSTAELDGLYASVVANFDGLR